MVEIKVGADDTLTVKWTGRKGTGSLYQIMAEANAKDVNRLEKQELWACFLCARTVPFPMGGGEKIYTKAIALVRDGTAPMGEAFVKASLGECRKAYVIAAGDGCNAPKDTYLKIAVQVRQHERQAGQNEDGGI
jgi:hypothetical protein